MIIYLYGPDSYRRHKKLQSLIKEYKEKCSDMDFLSVNLEETPEDWFKVRDFLSQPSMFVESKLAVIKESGSVIGKEWVKLLKSQIETQKIFILIFDNGEPKKAFSFLLEKPVQNQSFSDLKGAVFEEFLRQEAEIRGLNFSPDGWQFLISYFELKSEKTWAVVNEFEKVLLSNFENPVTAKNLQILFNKIKQPNFYYFINELSGTSISKKLVALENLFLSKEVTLPHLFNLLPYRLSGKELLRIADCDIRIKSGLFDYEEALTDLVLSG